MGLRLTTRISLRGLNYADQRYYAATYGRFITADPSTGSDATDPRSWNRYAYAEDDPINYLDPSGRARCAAVIFQYDVSMVKVRFLLASRSNAQSAGRKRLY